MQNRCREDRGDNDQQQSDTTTNEKAARCSRSVWFCFYGRKVRFDRSIRSQARLTDVLNLDALIRHCPAVKTAGNIRPNRPAPVGVIFGVGRLRCKLPQIHLPGIVGQRSGLGFVFGWRSSLFDSARDAGQKEGTAQSARAAHQATPRKRFISHRPLRTYPRRQRMNQGNPAKSAFADESPQRSDFGSLP